MNEGWNFIKLIKDENVYQSIKNSINSINKKKYFKKENVFFEKLHSVFFKLQEMEKQNLIITNEDEVKKLLIRIASIKKLFVNDILSVVRDVYNRPVFTEGDLYLQLFKIYLDNYDKTENEDMIDTFNFTYNPIMPFSRAKIQQGLFIYQV
ncbi:hypothetical protein [Lactococcus lactis]|uniref:Uncharacterized protein n=1 Tax=Lactococcus lactis subsp. hordniae TaxID=203404 RepID=A0A5M9QBP1_LACLH|nr:hypothetical protein [Lactococcus lactis]KAA8704415.1 hypothetical protein F4V48_02190 [Lactococcus lactis subsp. hordniae]MCT3134011.1 hypothetical protein [Lactococcus lactis]